MRIIIKPVITEKTSKDTEKFANRYTFRVAPDANTMNYDGKLKARYTKSGLLRGKVAAFKKAVVTLAEGQTIDFYANI